MSASCSPRPLSPRAVLYGRCPAGVGTPLVESLSGYLSRLCAARAVRIVDVLDRLVRPLVPESTLPPYRELSWLLVQQFVEFDGLGRQAATLVGALARLTGRTDLAGHTFLPWRRLFSVHRSGVVRRAGKRWCARCLDEWHVDGVEPWEPLLWRLAPAEWCPVHRVPLSQRCPSCGRRLRLVTERVPPGHCERCGVLLHRGDPALRAKPLDRRASRDVLWGWWVSAALGRMLGAQAEGARHVTSEGFVHLITESIARPGSGVLPLSRRLGVTSTPLLRWRDRECLPRLSTYLDVCIRLDADPADVGTAGHGPRADDSPLPWRRACRPGRSRSDPACGPVRGRAATDHWSNVEARLDRVIQAGDFRTVEDVVRRLGIRATTFANRLPEHHSMVVAQCEERRAAGCQAFRDRCESVLDAALAAVRPPSACAVARKCGVRLGTLKGWFPKRYARLVERHAEARAQARARLLVKRRHSVHAAVSALVDAGKPPSLHRTVRRAGLSDKLRSDPAVRAMWLDALAAFGVAPLGRRRQEATGEGGQDGPGAQGG